MNITPHKWTHRPVGDRSYQLGCRCQGCTNAHTKVSRRYAGRPDDPDFDHPWLVLNVPRVIFDRSIPLDEVFRQLEADDDRLATALRPIGLRPGVKAAISAD